MVPRPVVSWPALGYDLASRTRPLERFDPIHLLMPFASSILVVVGLLFLKRAQEAGASTWTSMILVCWASAAVFPLLAVLGGNVPSLVLVWQPALIGGLFLTGQLFMFFAVDRGDVSIAAPVLGVKVLIVPAAAYWFLEEPLTPRIWIAAAIAVVGIGCVQARDASVDRSRIAASVLYALLAATTMTAFDLLIQRWAPAWGAGYFLPIAFAFAALLSLIFLPLADSPAALRRMGAGGLLAAGSFLLALQAIGMTVTLGFFGDATRVNIVYSLRGIWGVLLTWWLAGRVVVASPGLSHRTMLMRLLGAALIGVSVVISVS